MSRSKYSDRRCNHCNKVTRMELVGPPQEGQEKAWFRCTRCHHMTLLSVTPAAAPETSDTSNAQQYTPDRTYNVGDAIFHSEWNDFGKVVSKTRMSNGFKAIVVNFENQGQRTLIEEMSMAE